MGIAQIENPQTAFSSAGQDNVAVVSRVVLTLPVGTTVLTQQLVALSYSATTGQYTIAPATASATNIIGATLEAGATGALVRVVTLGPAQVLSGATLATGAVVAGGATGALAAGSATAAGIGTNIGFMIASVATAAVGQVWIGKSS